MLGTLSEPALSNNTTEVFIGDAVFRDVTKSRRADADPLQAQEGAEAMNSIEGGAPREYLLGGGDVWATIGAVLRRQSIGGSHRCD